MILHEPELSRLGDSVHISARVEPQNPVDYLPERLWFQFPALYADQISLRSDPYLVGLLPIAMNLGETLQVQGELTPGLLSGLEAYQRHFHQWDPRLFSQVEISVHKIKPSQLHGDRGQILSFSGGLDSFYTLWWSTQEHADDLDRRLSHAFFVHGFDVPLQAQEAYQGMLRPFQSILEDLGIELIPVKTNVRLFSQLRIDWNYAYGCALVGAAMCLTPLVKRFLTAGGVRYYGTHDLESHLFSDPWLSSEDLEVRVHGAGVSRLQKLEAIGDWPPTHDALHVCIAENTIGLHNCGRCEKCLRTRTSLHLTGRAGVYSTFPEVIRSRDFIYWALLRKVKSGFIHELRSHAWEHKAYGAWLWLVLVGAFGEIRGKLGAMLVNMLPADHRLWLKSRFYGMKTDPLEGQDDGMDPGSGSLPGSN